MTTDVYTLTLTCQSDSTCGDQTYSYTSNPTAANNGVFEILGYPTLGGVYDVLITMENAATAADQNISTTVDNTRTLTVIDTTTVPSFCTVVASATTGDIVRPIGDTFTYTMQSKSSDGLDQTVTDDRYTVTLTSITTGGRLLAATASSVDSVVITATATAVSGSDGQYTADLQITEAGTYDVLVTMENASTDTDPEISTIVND